MNAIRDAPVCQRPQLGKHFCQGPLVPAKVPQAGPHEPDGAPEHDDARPHLSEAAFQPSEADLIPLVPQEQEPFSLGCVRVKRPEISLHRNTCGIPDPGSEGRNGNRRALLPAIAPVRYLILWRLDLLSVSREHGIAGRVELSQGC